MKIERVRRVVMGEPEPGQSRFSHIDDVEALNNGSGRNWYVWGWDAAPVLPHWSTNPFVATSQFPPIGGLRIVAASVGEPPNEADPEVGRRIAAEPVGIYADPERAGMHRTDTVDIGVIVSGEITSVADDGTRIVLGPGDVYIQNGALHSWEPNPENPAHIVFVILGVSRIANSEQ